MKQNKILSNIFVYIMALVVMVSISAFSVNAAQLPVNLGTAGNYVILAKSGISTTGTTSIVGNIGVSPIDSTAITGFGLIMDSLNEFSTSSLVTGKIYAADYAPPTPAVMTTAVSDMEIAYTDAAGRTLPDYTELGAGNIDGMTLAPGLYKWGTGVTIPNGVTLSGSSNDVWIFQIAQDLTVGNGAIVTLSGSAQAKNIFWQVAGQTTLGTTSEVKGNILSQTLIDMQTGATLKGRALAQTAVTLDANSVSLPAGENAPTNAVAGGVASSKGTASSPTKENTPSAVAGGIVTSPSNPDVDKNPEVQPRPNQPASESPTEAKVVAMSFYDKIVAVASSAYSKLATVASSAYSKIAASPLWLKIGLIVLVLLSAFALIRHIRK